MSEPFEYQRVVRFAECDPAGRMDTPAWLDVICELNEEWFANGLGVTFAEFHLRRGLAIPVINTRIEVPAASRPGETLLVTLAIEALGRSSMTLRIHARSGEELRLSARHKIVFISMADFRPIEIPAQMRSAAARFLTTASDGAEPSTFDLPRTRGAGVSRSKHIVRFAHCDPAGIMFYPRTFDLLAAALERWLVGPAGWAYRSDAADSPFLLGRSLIATREMTVEFLQPSRLGDVCDVDTSVRSVDGRSIRLDQLLSSSGVPRVKSTRRIELVDEGDRAIAIPDALRERLESLASTGGDSM